MMLHDRYRPLGAFSAHLGMRASPIERSGFVAPFSDGPYGKAVVLLEG